MDFVVFVPSGTATINLFELFELLHDQRNRLKQLNIRSQHKIEQLKIPSLRWYIYGTGWYFMCSKF